MFNEGNFQGEKSPQGTEPRNQNLDDNTCTPQESQERIEEYVLIASVRRWDVMARMRNVTCVRMPGSSRPIDSFRKAEHNILFKAARSAYDRMDDDQRKLGICAATQPILDNAIQEEINKQGADGHRADAVTELYDKVLEASPEEVLAYATYTNGAHLTEWVETRLTKPLLNMLANATDGKSPTEQLDAASEWIREALAAAAGIVHVDDDECDEGDDQGGRSWTPATLPILDDLVNEGHDLKGYYREYTLPAALAAVQAVVSATVRVKLGESVGDRDAIAAPSNWVVEGESGSGKSQAYKYANAAIRDFEREELARVVGNSDEIKRKKKLIEKTKAQLAKKPDVPSLEGLIESCEKDIATLSRYTQFLGDDTTPEAAMRKLCKQYNENKLGWASMYLSRDDAGPLLGAVAKDKYGKGCELKGMCLDLFSGGSKKRERVGDGEMILPHGYLHFFGSCTSVTFDTFAGNPDSKRDGLLGRVNMIRVKEREYLVRHDATEACTGVDDSCAAFWKFHARVTELIKWRLACKQHVVAQLSKCQYATWKITLSRATDLYLKYKDHWFRRANEHMGAILATLHALDTIGTDRDMTKVSDEVLQAATRIYEWLMDMRVRLNEQQAAASTSSLDDKVTEIARRKATFHKDGRKMCPLRACYQGQRYDGKQLTSKVVRESLKRSGIRIEQVGSTEMVILAGKGVPK